MNTIEWLKTLEWDYGFDRFSSHNSYKYEAQMMRLDNYLPTYMIRDLAEAIDKRGGVDNSLDNKKYPPPLPPCDTCKHNSGDSETAGTYAEICGGCCHFYADHYEYYVERLEILDIVDKVDLTRTDTAD